MQVVVLSKVAELRSLSRGWVLTAGFPQKYLYHSSRYLIPAYKVDVSVWFEMVGCEGDEIEERLYFGPDASEAQRNAALWTESNAESRRASLKHLSMVTPDKFVLSLGENGYELVPGVDSSKRVLVVFGAGGFSAIPHTAIGAGVTEIGRAVGLGKDSKYAVEIAAILDDRAGIIVKGQNALCQKRQITVCADFSSPALVSMKEE